MKVTRKYRYIELRAEDGEEIAEYPGAIRVMFVKYSNRDLCQCTNWDVLDNSLYFDENWQFAKKLAKKYLKLNSDNANK